MDIAAADTPARNGRHVTPSVDADMEACEVAIRDGSKSFHMASKLLPNDVRRAALALYAFCRQSDDLVDLGSMGRSAIDELSRRLDLAYAGRPRPDPIDRAFSHVVQQYSIPKTLPAALIEGFDWDMNDRRYETLEDLLDYCARVAGTVGAMMAVVMGGRSARTLARATDLGLAMQLTNIARDVGEDARSGRLYLPRHWMRREGIDPDAWGAAPMFDERIARVVARLLDVAEDFYWRGEAGIGLLPGPCRPAIRAASRVYREIGREVSRAGFDSVGQRAVVSKRRKLCIAATCAMAGPRSDAALNASTARANRFLVEAVTPLQESPPDSEAEGNFATMLELLMRVDARQRGAIGQG